MKKYLYITAMSCIPLIEQRGSIPLGFLLNLNPYFTFICAFLGSLIPIPFVFFLFRKILIFMKKFKKLNFLTNFIDNKINKNLEKFQKSKEIILISFIGIPLPTTGIYTGVAIASILNFSFRKTVFCAILGALISALLITALCLFAPQLASKIF